MPDLPSGVRAETGLLFRAVTLNPGAATNGSEVITPAVGPGFAVGIHGYQFGTTGWLGGDGERARWMLDLNADNAIVQTGLSTTLYYSDEIHQLAASSTLGPMQSGSYYNDAPVLVLKPFVVAFTPTIVAITLQMAVLFTIYRVSDSDFLRIAGLSLAQG